MSTPVSEATTETSPADSPSKTSATTAWSPQQITAIVMLVTYGLLIIIYCVYKNIAITYAFILTSVLLFVSIIMLSLETVPTTSDSFFFQVSPERTQCLLEQVAPCPSTPRSSYCCPRSTVGGQLPYYREWIQSDPYSHEWKRTDNVSLSPQTLAVETQIPPTSVLSSSSTTTPPPPKTSSPVISRRRLNRSQVDMYTQRL